MQRPHCSRAFLLALGLFLSVASSLPVSPRGRSFKVLVRRDDSYSDSPLPAGSGVAAMGRAYRKFGFPLPESPSSQSYPRSFSRSGEEVDAGHATIRRDQNLNTSTTAGKTSAGVIATAQEGDAEFLSPVTIGGQTVRMNFDTGSSDLLVSLISVYSSEWANLLCYTDGSSTHSFLTLMKPAIVCTILPNQKHSSH